MDYIISYNGLVYNHTKSDIPNEKEFSAHTHNKYEILYFMSGDVDCVIGNVRRTLKPGEMVLIPSLYVHYIDIIGTSPYERIVLNFDRSGADEKTINNIFSSPKIIDARKSPMLSGIFERLMNYSSIFADSERQILFYNILTELLYLIYHELQSETTSTSFDKFGKALQKSINYINDHLFEITDIEALCQELFISRAYIHKIFNNTLGMSPMKYIKTKRLISARELIRLGEKPSNVAAKVGFNDYTTFFRSYRRYFGPRIH